MDNVRLPDQIEQGMQGGPVFSTTIITLANGREARNQEWQVARHAWTIGYGITSPEEYEEVRQFFMARRGRARSFLFKDWSDYHATEEAVAAVTGNALQRQLVKTYTDDANPYVRFILYPVSSTLKVYVDTVLSTDYTLGDGGLLTFGSDPGDSVVATFDFDIGVRFDTDQLPITYDNFLSVEIPSIPVVEVYA